MLINKLYHPIVSVAIQFFVKFDSFFFSFRVSEELKGQTDILYGVEAWPLDFQNYLNRNYRKKDQKPMKKAEFESRMVQFLYREHS